MEMANCPSLVGFQDVENRQQPYKGNTSKLKFIMEIDDK